MARVPEVLQRLARKAETAPQPSEQTLDLDELCVGGGLAPGAVYPQPTMSRHEFLRGLHRVARPRTYLEIGIHDGASLALASCHAMGIDPAFRITRELHARVDLYRATSDSFFASHDVSALLGGLPVDFAYIDGMHHAEFAYRDFVNVESNSGAATVVVMDDMLPRTVHEAARNRITRFWAGDVFKVSEVLRRRRPDLLVLPVNTSPTGVVVVLGLDPASPVLADCYEEEIAYLTAGDPQVVPDRVLDRADSVDPVLLLRSGGLARLSALATSGADTREVRQALKEAGLAT